MQRDPRYPIGKFDRNIIVTKELRNDFINTIESLPALLRKEVENLITTAIGYTLSRWRLDSKTSYSSFAG